MADKTLNDTAYGVLRHEGNEVLNDSTVDDAAAFRGGAPVTQRTVVKYGGDVKMPDGRRIEVGQLSFKQSEHGNVTDGRFGGEAYFGLAKPGAGSKDAAMQDMYRAFPENTHPLYPSGVIVFEVPIEAPNMGGGVFAPTAQQLWDGTGMFFAQMQNDGNGVYNFVAYQASSPFSIANPVAVLFSSNDILWKLLDLAAKVGELQAKVAVLEGRR